MSTRFYRQSAKGDPDIRPCDPKSIGFLTLFSTSCMLSLNVSCHECFFTQKVNSNLDLWSHNLKSIGFLFSPSTTCTWSLKVIGLNQQSVSCSQGFIQRLQKLTLTLRPQNHRVLFLIIHNFHVKLESNWNKTVAYVVPIWFYTQML